MENILLQIPMAGHERNYNIGDEFTPADEGERDRMIAAGMAIPIPLPVSHAVLFSVPTAIGEQGEGVETGDVTTMAEQGEGVETSEATAIMSHYMPVKSLPEPAKAEVKKPRAARGVRRNAATER